MSDCNVNRGAAFGESLAKNFLNMFGLGEAASNFGFKTPLDKVNSDIADAKSKLSEMNQKFTIASIKILNQIDLDLFEDIQALQKNIDTDLNFVETKLQDEINLNTTYIAGLFVLTFVLFMYLLFLPSNKNIKS